VEQAILSRSPLGQSIPYGLFREVAESPYSFGDHSPKLKLILLHHRLFMFNDR